jgi:hypothetical protein
MVLKFEFMNIIVASDLPPTEKGHLLGALEKYVALDMALALSAYGSEVMLVD